MTDGQEPLPFLRLDAKITRAAKRRCLERELALRQRNYPKWVDAGRMRQEIADWELAVLEAILEDYQGDTQP